MPKLEQDEAMTTGRRYGGEQALQAGIVDAVTSAAVTSAEELPGAAAGIARPLAGRTGPTRAAIKETLYAEVLSALRAS